MKKPKVNVDRPEFMKLFANEMPPFMLARTSFLLHKVGIRMIEMFEESLAPLHIKPPHFMVMAVLSMEHPSSQIDIGDKVSLIATRWSTSWMNSNNWAWPNGR